ncbi:PREDICTED: uncharacterized protein LOC109593817 isoform X2 [Amphimedon queenslandica]|uniref:SEA domain-containing protein n=1 Tax=Amphimedon queenslandica TaxID=400682 RepID=A0AAN0K5D3_AMPQE|nr:PREDICTED: uncharacterized protein LOC109593817 isoform X2 [Amphimedon queenslandica]|eukprot:XP_019864479.1 PREDICTED: uncharacterized protein LOC109593817 isoform X2 [Amphimedon queenslandica]
MDAAFLLLLCTLTLTAQVNSQDLPIFRCPTPSMTRSCNEQRSEIFLDSCNSTQCVECLAGCETSIASYGTRCPSNECTLGLCAAYVSLTRFAPMLPCVDTYGSDYCSFCENCSTTDSGSGGGSGIIDAMCESNYISLFCRLLPNGSNCINDFGSTVCSYCQNIQALCSSLSPSSLNSTQNATLCSNHARLCLLYDTEPFCNLTASNATFCSYCKYTVNNGICPPLPICSNDIALTCRLLNSDDNCDTRINSDFCLECKTNYSDCGNIENLSTLQRNVVCESETALSCPHTLTNTNCSSVSTYTCNYCQATQDTCLYVTESGNGTIPCNSNEIEMCAVDYGYFPCYLLNDTNYCSNCSNSLAACNYPYSQTFIPPFCERPSFLSLCSYFVDYERTNNLLCSQVFSNYTCIVCPFATRNCTQTFSSSDGQSLLCSSDSISICNDFVYSDGRCLTSDSEIDCDFCLLQRMTCNNNTNCSSCDNGNEGMESSGSNETLTCDTFEALYCQLLSSDMNSCFMKYDATLCIGCSYYVAQCGPLSADNITQSQLDTLCIQEALPYCELAIITNSSSFCGDDSDCSYCFITEGICHSFSNETLQICANASAFGNCEGFLYYPCYTFFDLDYCDTCNTIVTACPNINYDSQYIPQTLCSDTQYLSFCNQIIMQQDCGKVYGYVMCDYCQTINATCPSVSPDDVLSSFNQFCLNNSGTCTQLLSSVQDNQCNTTYTNQDCAFCSLLEFHCNRSVFDLPCTKEFIFFCDSAYNQNNCAMMYPADTCQTCSDYLARCPIIETSSLDQFCASDASISTCGAYPYGTGCQSYFQSINVTELLVICDFCLFYGYSCHDIVCKDIAQQCNNIITYGVSPIFNFTGSTFNQSNDTDQCLPCSAAYAICLELPVSGGGMGSGSSIVDTGNSIGTNSLPSSFHASTQSVVYSVLPSSLSLTSTVLVAFSTITSVVSGTIDSLSVTKSTTDFGIIGFTSTVIEMTNPTTVISRDMDISSTANIISIVDSSVAVISPTTDIVPTSDTFITSSITATDNTTTATSIDIASTSSTATATSIDIASTSSTATATSIDIASTSFTATATSIDIASNSSTATATSVDIASTSSPSISSRTSSIASQTILSTISESTSVVSFIESTSSVSSRSTSSINTISVTPTPTTTSATSATPPGTTTRTTPSPTESPTIPTGNVVSVETLSAEEVRNAITLRFNGLTVELFLSRISDFIQAITSLTNKALSSTRKRQQAITSDGVLIVDGSLQLLSNNELEVAFLVRDTSGNVVIGSTVIQAIRANETSLTQSVGATGIARITEGVPEHLTPTPSVSSGGLSEGAIAGIVIAVLILVAVVLLLIAIFAYFYSKHGRGRGKYIFASEIAEKNLRTMSEIHEKDRTESVAMRHLSTTEPTPGIEKEDKPAQNQETASLNVPKPNASNGEASASEVSEKETKSVTKETVDLKKAEPVATKKDEVPSGDQLPAKDEGPVKNAQDDEDTDSEEQYVMYDL